MISKFLINLWEKGKPAKKEDVIILLATAALFFYLGYKIAITIYMIGL